MRQRLCDWSRRRSGPRSARPAQTAASPRSAQFVRRIPEFGQYRIRVLAQRGTASRRWCQRSDSGGANREGSGPTGESTSLPAIALGELGMADDVLDRVVARELPIPAASATDWISASGCWRVHSVMASSMTSRSVAAHDVGGEPRVGRQVRPFEHLERQPLPFAIVGRPEHDRLPVAGGVAAVGGDHGGAHPVGLAFLSGVPGVLQGEPHELGDDVEHADADGGADAGPLAGVQRGQHARTASRGRCPCRRPVDPPWRERPEAR